MRVFKNVHHIAQHEQNKFAIRNSHYTCRPIYYCSFHSLIATHKSSKNRRHNNIRISKVYLNSHENNIYKSYLKAAMLEMMK